MSLSLVSFTQSVAENKVKKPLRNKMAFGDSAKVVSFKGSPTEDLIGWHSSVIKTQLPRGKEINILPDPLRKLLEAIPKTELHLHLSGSTPRHLIREIYETTPQKDGRILTSPEIDAKMACIKEEYADLNDFLFNGYYVVAWTVQTPEQFKKAAREICLEAARENVKYIEIRTSLIKKDSDPQEILKAVADGIEEARVKLEKEGYKEVPAGFKQTGKIIILSQRHKSGNESLLHAKEAVKGRDAGYPVVGFDLAGSEADYPVVLHREAIEYAKAHGLNVTIHAGETDSSSFLNPAREKDPATVAKKDEGDIKEFKDDLIKMFGPNYLEVIKQKHAVGQPLISLTPYESMQKALSYGADRIGHAVHIMDNNASSAKIFSEMKQRQIPIESPPKSNVQIKAVDTYQAHPIKKMLDAGLNVSVSTDNRTMTTTDVTNEFAQLYLHGIVKNWNDIKTLTINGIKSAFLPEQEKQKLVKEFEADLQRVESTPLHQQAIKDYLTPAVAFLGRKLNALFNPKAA